MTASREKAIDRYGGRSDKILVVSATELFPLSDGIALRCFKLLEQLATRWPVVVIAPVTRGEEPLTSQIPALAEHRIVELEGSWQTAPWRFHARPLREASAHVLRETEIAAAVLWPGAEALCMERGFPPSVVDRIDSAALIYWRFINTHQGLRMKAWFLRHALRTALYEWRAAAAAAATVLVGEDDASVMGLGGRIGRTYVVPNGVTPFVNVQDIRESPHPTVVFTGVLDYEPNAEAVQHFVNAVWPAVRQAVVDARFLIVGRRPAEDILSLHGRDGIEVHADVPSIGAVLRTGWVAVAPMRSGSGLKNKILEAWIAGRPVVATSMATNGLQLTRGMAALVSNDPAEMASMIVGLLHDAAARRRLGDEAADHARGLYGWDAIGERFASIVSDVIERNPSGRRSR